MNEEFSKTAPEIAAAAHAAPNLVRLYADLGLIECRRLASGMRLFKPSAAVKVRAIKAERVARRGMYQREAATA